MPAQGALAGLIAEGGLSALTHLALRRNSIGAQGAQALAVPNQKNKNKNKNKRNSICSHGLQALEEPNKF